VRDYGAGLLPDKPGRATASAWLRGPVGLAWRLQRASLLGWAAGIVFTFAAARAAAGRLTGAAAIGKKAGEVLNRYKMAKHFEVAITDTSLTVERKQAQIDAEARLDGIYVIRTPLPAGDLDAAGTVADYKNLKYAERDFRHIKSDDLGLRPVFHRLERRVKGHVLICMLAAYLTWPCARPGHR
jgi:hypothetical protein